MPLTTEPPEPEAWLLTREVLDSLPVIRRDPGDGNGDRIGDRIEPVTAAVVPPDEDDLDPMLLDALRRLGNSYGPLGVAIAAASLTDPRALAAMITDTNPRDPRPEPAQDARSQIDRLGEYIAYNVPGEPSRSEGAVDCAIRLLDAALRDRSVWDERSREGRQQVDRLVAANDDLRRQLAVARATIRSDAEATEEQADALRAEVARLSAYGTEQYERAEHLLTERDEARRLYADAGRKLDERRSRAVQATTDQTGAPLPAPDPLGDRRPRLDRWPDDAVTLTYPELRCLVALHLDRYCDPGSGRAMREGDVPLRLSEVLDR